MAESIAIVFFIVSEKHFRRFRSPRYSGFSGLLIDQQRLLFLSHNLLRDHYLLDIGLRWNFVHQVHHDGFHYSTKTAGAGLALERLARDRAQRAWGELQVHVLHVEQLLILAHERVFRLGENPHQRFLVELAERRDHRQASDEFRNQAEFEQIFRLNLIEQLGDGARIAMRQVGAEAHRLARDPPADDVVEADESAAADEQDIGGIDLQEFLLRMLAAALGRDARHRALDNLEQGLLHAFAGDVAGDRRVVALARDLVDFVDINDAALAALDIVIGVLQQRQDDVLDVLADVARFGQRGRVGDSERHLQEAREGLRQQGLADAGGADQQDVRFLQFDVAGNHLRVDPLVMIMDRDRENFLGAFLADYVLIENALDLGRLGHRRGLAEGFFVIGFLRDYVVTEVDAFVTNIDRGPGYKFAYFVLAFAAERAHQVARAVVMFGHTASRGSLGGPPAYDYLINQSVFNRLFRIEEHIALGVLFDLSQLLSGVAHDDVVERPRGRAESRAPEFRYRSPGPARRRAADES